MKATFFTVVLPVHEGIHYHHFVDAFKSILSQTFRDFSVIVVFDGNVNSSISQYVSDNLNTDIVTSCFQFRENRGLAYGLNFAIRQSHSPWVVRMDADDISSPLRLGKYFEFIVNNDHVDIFGCFMSEFNGDIGKISRSFDYPTSHNSIVKNMLRHNSLSHATVCMRKATFDLIGGYPLISIRNEDTLFWVCAFKCDAIFSNLPEVLYYARFDESAVLRRIGIKKSLSDMIDRFRLIIDLNGSFIDMFVAILVFVAKISPAYSFLRNPALLRLLRK